MPRREFLTRAGVAGVGLAAAEMSGLGRHRAQAADPQVNWLGWTSYAIPEVMESFKKKSGTAVNLIPFNDNTEAYAKLKIGGGGQYDVIQADAFWPVKYYEDKLVQVIDMSALESAKTLFPEFRQFPAWKAGNGLMAYPNAWAPFCLVYNKKHFSSAPTSWEVFWDPKYKGRVAVRGGSTHVLPFCALMLGYEPFDMTKAQLDKAKDLAIKLKKNVKQFSAVSGESVRVLADESVWAVFESAPGVGRRARAAGGPPMGWTIPKEGTIGWVDCDMVATGATHKDAALKWIDYRSTPENHALLISKVFFGPTNKAAVDLLKKMGGAVAEAVQELGMDKPEAALKMKLVKPPKNVDEYTDTYNEVLAG
jgi:putative spermidine/putrescine transport system substrate-binding protein/spermidine/putrescine transport system substrate-binding protein